MKGTVDYFVDTVFNYPTLAECYKAAAFNGAEQTDARFRVGGVNRWRKTIGVVMTGAHRGRAWWKIIKVVGRVRALSRGMRRAATRLHGPCPPTRSANASASRWCSSARGTPIDAVGVALPGIMRNGRDRGLAQPAADQRRAHALTCVQACWKRAGIEAACVILNDADAVAAGIAATRGQLDS